MPFDDTDHVPSGGGRHREPSAEQCEAMHEMVEDYAEQRGLCPDCTMVKMGAGFLSYIVLLHGTKSFSEPLDPALIESMTKMMHKEVDDMVAAAVAGFASKLGRQQ